MSAARAKAIFVPNRLEALLAVALCWWRAPHRSRPLRMTAASAKAIVMSNRLEALLAIPLCRLSYFFGCSHAPVLAADPHFHWSNAPHVFDGRAFVRFPNRQSVRILQSSI
jgi:hypothetical protein